MNALELKGGMIEMIADIKSPEILQHLYQIVEEIAIATGEDAVEITAEQEARLDADLVTSELVGNLGSQEEAMKTMSRYSIKQAATPTRKNVSLAQLKKEQDYQPISYEKWREKADKIEWEESLEELLAAAK